MFVKNVSSLNQNHQYKPKYKQASFGDNKNVAKIFAEEATGSFLGKLKKGLKRLGDAINREMPEHYNPLDSDNIQYP